MKGKLVLYMRLFSMENRNDECHTCSKMMNAVLVRSVSPGYIIIAKNN